jgi:hypothetical protein
VVKAQHTIGIQRLRRYNFSLSIALKGALEDLEEAQLLSIDPEALSLPATDKPISQLNHSPVSSAARIKNHWIPSALLETTKW